MSTIGRRASRAVTWRWPSDGLRDALLLVLVAALTYAVIIGVTLHEGLRTLVATTQIDEALSVAVVVTLVFALRRWRQASRELTARRRAESALGASEERYRVAAGATRDVVYDYDVPGDHLLWNESTHEVFGEAPEAMGATLSDWIGRVHPDDLARVQTEMRAYFARGGGFDLEFRFRRADGAYVAVRDRGSVVLDSSGTPLRCVGAMMDLTALKATEDALRSARDAALDASEAKSAFLANMSHEIRTPMNAILGMADLLADTTLTGEQQEYVGIFRRAGDTLLALIDDILDLSKVEAGQLTLESTPFDLRELVEDTAEVLAARAHAKGLELLCEVTPDLPAWVSGDPHRLRQVLLNLIGNAIKFTARGEVHLHVERDAPGPSLAGTLLLSPATVRFSVRDTGIGIPADQQAAVFGTFTQVDASTTRRFGGTGLGLAIVERLVALMGGQIAVASTPGQGATFAFSVPLEPATVGTASAPAEPAVELAGARVLVVDDNATNRLILRRLLTPYGAEVTEVDGGAAGLAALRAARGAGMPYDLLLLDQQMPDLDGLQLVARVRAEAPDGAPGEAGEAVARAVLMLSSDQRVGDAARARALGIAHYLIKPVKRAALLATIVTTLRQHAAPAEVLAADLVVTPLEVTVPDSPAAEVVPLRRLRLLLVDDSADNRRLVQLYLSRLPYVLETEADGQAGLDAFRVGVYDLVLMDVQMPVLDGLSATRAIRAWERAQGRPPTPVVALTARVMAEDVQQALDAGCDAHLAKPLKKQALLEVIDRFAGVGQEDRPAVLVVA